MIRWPLCLVAALGFAGVLHAQTVNEPVRKLYVINTAGNDVTVVDVATNKMLGRIEVGPRPHGIAASASGDVLLVTVEGGKGELVWIDPTTDKVVRRLAVGGAPNQLAVTPDGKFAYVPVNGGTYQIVDVAQAKIIDKIFTGGQPHNTVCSADGQRMYLAPLGAPKKVTIVEVASRKIIGEIPFSNSVRPIALTKDEKKFFAQVDGLVGIEMADVSARKMVHRVPAEVPAELKKISSRSHGLGVRPGDKEVWDCDVERKVVHVYDITGEKPKQVATIPIGGTVYWLTFDPDGKYAYVSVRSSNEVAVVDAAKREVVARIPVGKEPKRLLVVEIPRPSGQDPKKTSTEAERIEKIRADLKSDRVEVRRAAILSLVHSGVSGKLRTDIQDALGDKDAEVRATAATATGNLGAASVPAVPTLIAMLESEPSKEARETAARALGRIGKAAKEERRAVSALRKSGAKDADPVTRVVALGALAMMDVDVPDQIAAIRKFLHHETPLVRMKAAHGLGMIGPEAKTVAPDIVTVLERAEDVHHRGYIARALGNVGDPASLPALYQAIGMETDPGTRGEIQGAISRLGGKVPNQRLVLASASYGKNLVAICDADGKILWSHKTAGPKTGHAGHHDLQFLDNGNILFHDNWTTIVEMTLDKKIVWTYDSGKMNGNDGKRVEVHAFQRLPNGLTMIAESGVGRIIEVDKDGKIHAEIRLKPGGAQHTRMARKLDNGNYLVCAENPGVVTEYSAKSEVVWEYPIKTRVYGAIRLRNGNTLIASGSGAGGVEVTRDGKVVWKIKDTVPDTKIALKWTTFLTELDNGNFIVGNCHAGENSPQIFEITRDKKVVWQFNQYETFGNGLACSQVLNDKQAALVRKLLTKK